MIALYFIKALVSTEVIEIIVAFLLGYRGKKFYTILILINIITNPMLNCIVLVLYYFSIDEFFIVPVLELLVVIVEWRLFIYALKKNEKSYLLLCIIINLSSYLIGVLFFQ
ncbi:MAG TPA: hypothetical protein VIK72_07935 [Clostridiaceae bacterium]